MSALSRRVGWKIDGSPIDGLPDLERAIGIIAELSRGRFELVSRKAPLLQDATATRGERDRVSCCCFSTS